MSSTTARPVAAPAAAPAAAAAAAARASGSSGRLRAFANEVTRRLGTMRWVWEASCFVYLTSTANVVRDVFQFTPPSHHLALPIWRWPLPVAAIFVWGRLLTFFATAIILLGLFSSYVTPIRSPGEDCHVFHAHSFVDLWSNLVWPYAACGTGGASPLLEAGHVTWLVAFVLVVLCLLIPLFADVLAQWLGNPSTRHDILVKLHFVLIPIMRVYFFWTVFRLDPTTTPAERAEFLWDPVKALARAGGASAVPLPGLAQGVSALILRMIVPAIFKLQADTTDDLDTVTQFFYAVFYSLTVFLVARSDTAGTLHMLYTAACSEALAHAFGHFGSFCADDGHKARGFANGVSVGNAIAGVIERVLTLRAYFFGVPFPALPLARLVGVSPAWMVLLVVPNRGLHTLFQYWVHVFALLSWVLVYQLIPIGRQSAAPASAPAPAPAPARAPAPTHTAVKNPWMIEDSRKSSQRRGASPRRDSSSDPSACVVCTDTDAIVAMVPCGHMALCIACCEDYATRYEAEPHNPVFQCCPVCKEVVEQVVRVYGAA